MITPYRRKYSEYFFFYNFIERICFVQKTWLYFPFFISYRARCNRTVHSLPFLKSAKSLLDKEVRCSSYQSGDLTVLSLLGIITQLETFPTAGLLWFYPVWIYKIFFLLVKFSFFYLWLFFIVGIYELHTRRWMQGVLYLFFHLHRLSFLDV